MSEETIPLRRPGGMAPSVSPTKEPSKYPTEVVPLPTKGKLYPKGHPLSTGNIELKQMTAREEDILANQELIRKGTVLDKLIESLIVDKSIRVDEIFSQDKNAILIAVRRLAYGDEYPVVIKCPNCSETNKVTINLGTIENKEVSMDAVQDGVNEFSYELPSAKRVITFKLLNQVDELSIEQELKNLKKINKDSNSELTTRLKYVITSVDGNHDKSTIRKFVDEEFMAKDSLALRKHMKEVVPNIDLMFDFKCEKCDHERRMDVPLGASFLWPDIEA